MKCSYCGEPLNKDDKYCPACGAPVEKSSGSEEKRSDGPQYYTVNKETPASDYSYDTSYQGSSDSGSIGWGFLGCCFPLVGLILYLVWNDSKPMSAKKAGIGAIVGVVICLVAFALVMLTGILFGAATIEVNGLDFGGLESDLEDDIISVIHMMEL